MLIRKMNLRIFQEAPLIAHTVPSNWVGRKYDDQQKSYYDLTINEPYRRIVGFGLPNGEELWAPPVVPVDKNSVYTKADVSSEIVPFNVALSARMALFFRTFLAEGANPRGVEYNCHLFSAHLLGQKILDFMAAERYADNFIDAGTLEDRQPDPGEQVVFGKKVGGEGMADHSANGYQADEYLQVMWRGGHMGIAQRSSLMEFYDLFNGSRIRRVLHGITNIGRYTMARSVEAQPTLAV